MSKIYLHYEGERGPDHTFIWRQAGGLPFTGRSLGDALVGFIGSYNRKHGCEAYSGGKWRERQKFCAREVIGDVWQLPLFRFTRSGRHRRAEQVSVPCVAESF